MTRLLPIFLRLPVTRLFLVYMLTCYISACSSTAIQSEVKNLGVVQVTGSRIKTVPAPTWNVWFEAGAHPKANGHPVSRLRPGFSYSLIVDFSKIQYVHADIAGTQASQKIIDYLRSLEENSTTIRLLPLYDDRYFEKINETLSSAPLTIDLARLKYSVRPEIDPEQAEELARNRYFETLDVSNPMFREHFRRYLEENSLGRVAFQLQINPAATGETSIGFSVWAGNRPIGEFAVETCIGEKDVCERGIKPLKSRSEGFEQVAAEISSTYPPSLAIQLFSLGNAGESQVVGVLQCGACGDAPDAYTTWRLGRTESELVAFFGTTIRPAFERAAEYPDVETSSDAFKRAGQDLTRAVFGSSYDGRIARNRFFEFTKRFSKDQLAGTRSVFFRYITEIVSSQPIYGLPLGAMVVPVDASGAEDFLGWYFRVESPLRYQAYTPPSKACLRSWIALVPPAAGELSDTVDEQLKLARQGFLNDWVLSLKATNRNLVYEDLNEFSRWLSPISTEGYSADGRWLGDISDGLVVSIFSHHDTSELFFNEGSRNPRITSDQIERHFGKASVVILNGCGTTAPGAVDFVSAFNQQGVSAVIGAAVSVDAQFAAKFLVTVSSALNASNSLTIGSALFVATRELKADYGARPLIYSIIGDASLKLCRE